MVNEWLSFAGTGFSVLGFLSHQYCHTAMKRDCRITDGDTYT